MIGCLQGKPKLLQKYKIMPNNLKGNAYALLAGSISTSFYTATN
jgi:hypothetical protein